MKRSKEELQRSQRLGVEARRVNNAMRQRMLPQPDSYRHIQATNGKLIKVNCEDFEFFIERSWRLNDRGYAISDQSVKRMHRQVMELALGRALEDKEQVDHINGDRSDNRRHNLRTASNQENCFNQRPRQATSRFKGVYWYAMAGKWRASIQPGGVKVHCGTFDDEVEAAYMYDQYALELFGEYAYLNILGD
jgi:hypothetical protein